MVVLELIHIWSMGPCMLVVLLGTVWSMGSVGAGLMLAYGGVVGEHAAHSLLRALIFPFSSTTTEGSIGGQMLNADTVFEAMLGKCPEEFCSPIAV